MWRVLAILLLAGCADEEAAPMTFEPPDAGPPPPESVTGTWRGEGRLGVGQPSFTWTWVLTQRGDDVTGVSQFVDGFVSGYGELTATFKGASFTFRDVYPPGALDRPDCDERDTGVLTVSGDRMYGTFRSVSNCGRMENGTVTFTLTR